MNRKNTRPASEVEKKQPGPKEKARVTWPVVAFQVSMLFDKVADKFGICAVVFVLVVGTVWLLGDQKTQDDFVRELLFREVTHTPYLSVLMVMLLSGIVVTGLAKRSKRNAENAEISRLAQERNDLQQQRLNVPIESSGVGE